MAICHGRDFTGSESEHVWAVASKEDEEQWFICNRQLQSLDAPSLCQVLGLWKEAERIWEAPQN